MNNYSSRLDNCSGMDAYNLPWPVLPPAALSLTATLFTPRYLTIRQSSSSLHRGDVIGFNRRDQMYIRSLAIDSNFADGLVDNVAQHGYSAGPGITTKLDRFMAAGTGTISNDPAATPTAITGVGTLFLSEYAPGQTVVWVDNGGNIQIEVIASIASNTAMTITASSNLGVYAGIVASGRTLFGLVIDTTETVTIGIPTLVTKHATAYFQGAYEKIRPTRGTVSIVAAVAGQGTIAMVGKGTCFTRDLTPLQFLRYQGDNTTWICVQVLSVTDDTHATLVVPATGTAGLPIALTDGYLGITALTGSNIPDPDVELKALTGWQDSFLAIRAGLQSINGSLAYSTISVDPAYSTAGVRLCFNYIAEVEHTFATSSPGRLN